MAQYLRTRVGTGCPAHTNPGRFSRLVHALLFLIPVANPDYEAMLPLVAEWLIEFDDNGDPWREIGLDANGEPVLAGPNEREYGFWLDTGMRLPDFAGDAVAREDFEALWARCPSHSAQDPSRRPTRACS